ncbi:MAG: hypothetical protein R2690_08215 [Acidimicrobiales bacterium]
MAFAARAYLGVAAVLFTVNAVVFHLFEHTEALPKAEGFPAPGCSADGPGGMPTGIR